MYRSFNCCSNLWNHLTILLSNVSVNSEKSKKMKEDINIDHLSEKAQKDYELVLRATKGKDQQAFSFLMERYKDSIYFMLLKMVNNKDDADDLTIEAFGKAFNALAFLIIPPI